MDFEATWTPFWHLWGLLEGLLAPGDPQEAPRTLLGASWTASRTLLESILEPTWAQLETTWSQLGPNLRQLGANMRPTWVQVGSSKPSWGGLVAILRPLEAHEAGGFDRNLVDV